MQYMDYYVYQELAHLQLLNCVLVLNQESPCQEMWIALDSTNDCEVLL
jgi:hypothetical protein